MNDSRNLNSEDKITAPTPANIYTLAHAVRHRKEHSSMGNAPPKFKARPSQNNSVSEQIKQIIKSCEEGQSRTKQQQRSRLPLQMVVSKMATRRPRPIEKENEEAFNKIDLSNIRNYKLAPLSQHNKFRQRTMRTTNFKKVIDEMKEKRAIYAPDLSNWTSSFCLNQTKLKKLISENNFGNQDDLSTPRLEYNYKQLYDSRLKIVEEPSEVLDEDPLGSNKNEDSQEDSLGSIINEDFQDNQSGIETLQTLKKDHEKPQVKSQSPQTSSEFIWNPVIVPPTNSSCALDVLAFQSAVPNDLEVSKQNSHCYDTEKDYSHNYRHDLSAENSSRIQEVPSLLLSNNSFEYQEPFNYQNISNTNQSPLAARFGSPCSSGHGETSSTSSGHTLAEERFRLTFYSRLPSPVLTPYYSTFPEMNRRRTYSPSNSFEE